MELDLGVLSLSCIQTFLSAWFKLYSYTTWVCNQLLVCGMGKHLSSYMMLLLPVSHFLMRLIKDAAE